MKAEKLMRKVVSGILFTGLFCQSITAEEYGELDDYKYVVVDTGQSNSYNNTKEITAPANGDDFYGQDAQFNGNQPSYTLSADGLTVYDNNTKLTWQKSADTDGDGDIDADDKLSHSNAQAYADDLNTKNYGGYNDWRLPSIKELYSLIDFDGTDPNPESTSSAGLIPYINTDYFDFEYGDTSAGERIIDAQYATSTLYVSSTGNDGGGTMFGVNFADGRIKGYGLKLFGSDKTFFVICVRSDANYGQNSFSDNGDDTISDNATGLMWSQGDSEKGLNWQEALAWVQTKNSTSYLGYNDWRLPNAKELQSIVDYSRSPDTTNSAAIDPLFNCTSVTNEAEQSDFPYYWTGTTHISSNGMGSTGVYIAFGRGMGYMNSTWVDVHGAGCQRSDPKTGDPDDYPYGRGPQGDAIHIYNYVRLVRDAGTVEYSPEIQVIENSVNIIDGSSSVDFGSTAAGTPVSKTFTVNNLGNSDLTLSEPITVPGGFTVTSSFNSTTLSSNASTTFIVELDANTAGSYNGTLSFANNDSDENPFDFTISGTVTEAPSELKASFSYSPESPAIGESVTFTDTSVGTPTSWSWNFGDGNSSTEQHPTHSYSEASVYSVVLTVADGSDSTDTKSVSLTVNESGSAPTITQHPKSISAVVGDTVSFTVTASGSTQLSYMWFVGGVEISGANESTYSLPSAEKNDEGSYYCVVSNDFGSATSSSAILTITEVIQNDEDYYLSRGSIIKIDAADYGLEEFSSKPKIYALINGKKKKLAVIESVNKNTPAASVTAVWKRKYKIYNASDYKSVKLSDLLIQTPIEPLELDSVIMKIVKEETTLAGNYYLACPEITTIDLVPETAGDEFTVIGRYFGSSLPTVKLEYLRNGDENKPAYTRCKVLKTESRIYKDAYSHDNKSCMKVQDDDLGAEEVGYSQVKVVYPNLSAKHTATGYIILDNGIGLDAYKLNSSD